LGLVTVTGCSGSTSASGGGSAPVANTSSPLAPYRAGLNAPVDPVKANLVQEKIAACMKTAGFQYLPVPIAAPDPTEPVYGDRAWTQKYGYGISTSFQAIDLTPASDPNSALLKKMTGPERMAYNKALNGGIEPVQGGAGGISASDGSGAISIAGGSDSPVVVGADGASPQVAVGSGGAAPSGAKRAPAPVGCASSANTAVFGSKPQVNTADFQDLFKQMDKLANQVDADPRVIPKIAAWAGCMAQAGSPGFSKIADARNSVEKIWADLNGFTFTPDADGPGGTTSITSSTAEGPKKLDPAKLAAFSKTEVATAIKDLDCRAGYQGVHDQVRIELETKFVADHKAELERYRNAINGGK